MMMMMMMTGKDQWEYTTALTACRDVSQSQLSSPLPSSFWYNDDEDDGDVGGGGDDYADGEGVWRVFFVKNKAGISDLGIQTLSTNASHSLTAKHSTIHFVELFKKS